MTSTPTGARQNFDPSDTTQLRLPSQGTGTLRRIKKTLPKYDYEHYSRLAGPLTQPDPGRPYKVQYRSLISQEPHRIRVALMLAAAPLLSLVLLAWLLQPEHWTERDYPAFSWLPALDIVMLVSIGLIEFFRCMNVLSNAHATLVARDPIPVVPETGTRVAFLTSFVPGKEPLEMVTKTLEAAVRIRHRGLLHVWLLDEGDDPAVKEVCARLGVHHFSRKGIEKWNQPKGPHRAKTKHGNYNAWLDAHGDQYDFFASVDTDHVPLPNYLERMLGFFRDPDIGFVIGPQVYGNYDNFVTKAAESQQFLFHALIQRAGNKYGAPMFVGTSNAVRIKALKQIGGLYDSITEDMATGFEIHRHKNPATGRKWRSVYTPDVLAVGEGPSAWTDFFTQQMRWSRGTYETILKQYWKGWYSLPPGKLFNYTMMIIFYPMSALNWILAALSCTLFLGLGASGVNIDPTVWLMLYGNASALQIGLYIWNRRHNVSPHEPEGSGGVAGMVMSALSAPLYAKALVDSLLRRKSKFVVTPKGDSASPDRWFATFRYHWYFILIFGGSIGAGIALGHSHPAMIIWATFAMLITATPIFTWRHMLRQAKKKPADAPPEAVVPAQVPAQASARTQYQPQPLPAAPHAPAQKPSWVDSHTHDEGTDQTMQIALGGLGGRKE
ncbi:MULTISPECIES: cellulose synthase catalytic subunit [Streptomyces]|uniref:Glycosyl transferase n=1 Tax=Streptomyces sviceus (strain ATCC 29083 / DSM 924 / JCM 4929 / NBRC 13980 / NCIMB 11184 / NRRL 5439 / UC 5370) TaxID=463191 RepID=B5HNN2_STRX2|nr:MULTISPECIES: cellulose synthase catalytic subunit [Streptomyces]EDY54437.1 glycosyl transferase [Streptomyces sviceus ATCC 29083]MYT06070.1 glycosyltransferase [Streptomyces sp. SID5470]